MSLVSDERVEELLVKEARLESENKRLREAIRWIADHSNDPGVVRYVWKLLDERKD